MQKVFVTSRVPSIEHDKPRMVFCIPIVEVDGVEELGIPTSMPEDLFNLRLLGGTLTLYTGPLQERYHHQNALAFSHPNGD